MDVGLSVSRVGGMAQTPAMRTVAGRLRIDLTQHHEMSRFVKFGAEVDAATLQQLRRGERELEVLKQSAHSPLPLEREIVMLLAAVDGHLDAVPVDRIRDLEQPLFEMLEREYADELRTLRETHELTPATQQRLGRIIDQFVAASAPKAEAPSPARGATG